MRESIPSLNGLRAISIGLVIISHISLINWQDKFTPLGLDMRTLGQLGVNVFFVISGFLITTLLLKEEQNAQTISLKNFYLRRVFRIFPVYYIMLLVYAGLQLLGLIHLNPNSWIRSILFLNDFGPLEGRDWPTYHTWSLSIEEQFYLFWPFLFKAFKPLRNYIALCIICVIPAFRIYSEFGHSNVVHVFSLFYRVDAIMWGCFLALNYDGFFSVLSRINKRFRLIQLLPFIIIYINMVLPYINFKYSSYVYHFYIAPLGGPTGTLTSICICLIVIYSIKIQNIWFSVLNSGVFNYIGKLSYSIYLWQQIIFVSAVTGCLSKFPYNVVLILIVAAFSYHFIEKPFLSLKKRFEA